jgi:hypothetical protein
MRAREIIAEAAFKAGIASEAEPLEAEAMARGLADLRGMFKTWSSVRYSLFRKDAASITLTTAASYAVTGRPMRILSARLKRGSVETPMQEMTRDEYDTLPVKTSQGLPTTFHYARGATAGTLYIWPVLAAANGETLELTIERAIALPDGLDDYVDIPAEWEEAAVYNLAVRIGHSYPSATGIGDVGAAAAELLATILSDDREGSVWFGPCA